MPSARRMRSRWPPSPSVEDEIQSLSREYRGLSQLGQKPGLEGVCARGTIDQYPVLVTLDITPPKPSSIARPTSLEDLSRGNSSSDDSAGPPTPSTDTKLESLFYSIKNSSSKSFSRMTSSSQTKPQDSTPRGRQASPQVQPPVPPSRNTSTRGRQATPQVQQPVPPSRNASTSQRRPVSRPPASTIEDNRTQRSSARSSSVARSKTSNAPASSSQMRPQDKPVAPALPAPAPPAAALKPTRSKSVRVGRAAERSSTDNLQRPPSASGYLSDSITSNTKSNSKRPGQSRLSCVSEKDSLSVAERLEKKLRRRQKLRDSGVSSDQDTPNGTPNFERRVPEPQFSDPAQGSRSKAPSTSSKPAAGVDEEDPFAASFAAVSSLVDSLQNPARTNEPPPRYTSSEDVRPPSRPSRPSRSRSRPRRTVSFLDQTDEQPASSGHSSGHSDSDQGKQVVIRRTSRRSSPIKEVERQPSPVPSGLCLLPCPRSIPMAGHQDWYTIKGLAHLDICPSCMEQMSKSVFRDFFIPSAPKPRGQRVSCSFSEPWTRLAWVQTIKKQHDNLDMLYQVTWQPASKPCPGRIVSEQYWYRVIDPETGMYLPKFNVCGACIRNVRILMPAHRESFKRSTVMQERACDFVSDSPRFIQYIDCLDITADRAAAEGSSRPDMDDFLSYARRKVVLRDCRRDRVILSTWHYMRQLPELTVCEDCYDDVVWPLVKDKQPIARKFSTSMRLLPGDDPSRCGEASCQLYSPRMRAKFREAVQRNDLTYLKLIGLRRYEAEQRFWDRRQELVDKQRRGYECEADFRKNVEEWKRWE